MTKRDWVCSYGHHVPDVVMNNYGEYWCGGCGGYYKENELLLEPLTKKDIKYLSCDKEELYRIWWHYTYCCTGEPLNDEYMGDTRNVFDGTDGACPAWWRGCDHGVDQTVKLILKAINKGQLSGAYNKDIQEILDKIEILRGNND